MVERLNSVPMRDMEECAQCPGQDTVAQSTEWKPGQKQVNYDHNWYILYMLDHPI